MDKDLENRVNLAIEQLKQLTGEESDLKDMDPAARMMLIASINEAQKIHDHIDHVGNLIEEKYCSDFIPNNKIAAVPSIAVLNPTFKPKRDTSLISIGSGASFSYKVESLKQPLNYIPLFSTIAIPYQDLYVLSHSRLSHQGNTEKVEMKNANCLWIGVVTNVEIDTLNGMSLLFRGIGGIEPQRIIVGNNETDLEFATMREMENIEMAEPFDAQQSSGKFFSLVEAWKEQLLNMGDASLVYITDRLVDRDTFKTRSFPNSFKRELEDEILNCFDPNTLWLKVEFPEGCTLTSECEVIINAFPVVNVDQNTLMLTQATPIAKLQKQEDAFFLCVTETSSSAQRQGFGSMGQDIIIRDFDTSRYNNGDLYRDVRNLYNHFIDDYYAFIEYYGIKDGEALRQLRQAINQIGKSVGSSNLKFKYDSGTYVLKNMDQDQNSSAIKVSYLTTQGRIGNKPLAGELMDNKKVLAIEQKVKVLIGATGGRDKASPDERYELLRYYTLTNDRLYTKMDIDAFLRKEIIAEFGKEEYRRVLIRMNIEGTEAPVSLRRGLHIDILFKDTKNYDRAVAMSLDTLLMQRIKNRSCIAMPIIIKLINLERK